MKTLTWSALVVLLALPAGCDPAAAHLQAPKEDVPDPSTAFAVVGRTQCVPGKKGLIAPVPLHPVVQVLVKPGDRVQKDQKLVLLDDDEAKADVRGKEALLEGARLTLKETRRHLTAAEKAYNTGALPELTYFTLRTAAAKAAHDERAAQAALEAAKAELEHYSVTAVIEGMVAWLDVQPGMVSRPGTTVWGEILDLSELDVRCDLTPEQADRVALGQRAEVWVNGQAAAVSTRIAYVGIAADLTSGKVPACVRLPNLDGRLRCGVPVRVRFPGVPESAGGS